MAPLAHLPDALANPIRRCLEKDPRDRYQTPSELAGALERAAAALGGRGTSRGAASGGAAPAIDREGATAAPPGRQSAPPPVDREAATAAPPGGRGTPAHAAAEGATVAQPRQPVEGQTMVQPQRAAAAPPPPPPQQAETSRVGGAASGIISLSLTPGGPASSGAIGYTLSVANAGQAPAALRLTANEPTGALQVSAPPTVTVAPGQTEQLRLEIRQIKKVRKATPLQLQVAALGEGGERRAFVNTSVMPAASGGGAGRLLAAIAAGVALVAVIAGGFLLLRGGEDSPAEAAPSAVPTDAVSQPTTPPQPTVAPRTVQARPQWDYAFRVASNDCGFGAQAGDRYSATYKYQPSGGGAELKNGDRVAAFAVTDRDVPLGTFTFRAEAFEVTYPVAAADGKRGNATLVTTFADDSGIQAATLTERYDGPACAIVASHSQ
jgi:hypothetical protein